MDNHRLFSELERTDSGAGGPSSASSPTANPYDTPPAGGAVSRDRHSDASSDPDLAAYHQALEQGGGSADPADAAAITPEVMGGERLERSLLSGRRYPSLGNESAGTRILNQRLSEARRQALLADQERRAAEKRAKNLEQEMQELRGKMDEYLGELHSAAGGEGEALDALRAELELVRYQASLDLEKLRGELEAARSRPVLADADRQGEERVLLERELSVLQTTLEGREAELSQLREELAESREQYQEAEARLQQSQRSCNELTSKLQAAGNGLLADERVRGQSPVLDPRRWFGGGSDWNKMVIGLAVGVFATLALLGWLLVAGEEHALTATLQRGVNSLAGGFDATQDRRVTGVGAGRPPEQPRAIVEKSEQAPAESIGSGVGETAESVSEAQRIALPESREAPFSAGPALRDRLADGGWGPRMIKIPAARFVMGSRVEGLFPDEEPARLVDLHSFYISQHETSFGEYERFARLTGRALPHDQGWGREGRPVINVTWADARDYANWLSAQTGHSYRLPSEAEWEYAASGGSDSFFWWSDQLGQNQAVCFDCGSEWDGRRTAPVGSLRPNRFGLYDTAGNVMEWVADCYHPDYRGAPVDGSAWVEAGCMYRVARGGAFNRPSEKLRTTSRTRLDAAVRLDMLGFRLVREP